MQEISSTPDSALAFTSAVKANDAGNVVASLLEHGSSGYVKTLAIDFHEPKADPGPGPTASSRSTSTPLPTPSRRSRRRSGFA